MLIVYRIDTGEVVDNTGTNSAMPEGPPDDVAYVNVPDDLPRRMIDTVRLHDDRDAALVARVLANRHHVDPTTGEVVIDGPYPTPEPGPVEPTADDRLDVLEEAVADATGRTVEDLRADARSRAAARRQDATA